MAFLKSDRHLFTTMTPDSSDPDIVSIFDQLARCRRSIRGFLPTPVEQETLEQVFQTAAFAPSNCNTQPWYSYVVSGAKYDGIYRQRQLDVGLLLYKALGVTREDKEGKRQAFLRNLEFFDAPHVVFIFMQEWCGIREACDVGMYAQNLMLTMRSHGIASCPQTILGYDADSVRRELGIDAEMKLLFGISFGYEDQSLPENQIVPDRATLDEHVKFYR
jgi:nitroreductase